MSNRLFEGLTGGAAVICTSNPFIDKHFSNEIYVVESERGEAALAMQVVEVVRKIRAGPEAARENVIRGQRIMRQKFALERNLEGIIAKHSGQLATLRQENLTDTRVTIVADFRGTDLSSLERIVESLQIQEKTSVILHLQCDVAMQGFAETYAKVGGSLTEVFLFPFASASQPTRLDGTQPVKTRRGSMVADILVQ